MGHRATHTRLTREGEKILTTAGECFFTGTNCPLVPYLSAVSEDNLMTTEDQLNLLGFTRIAKNDNRIVYTIPATLTKTRTQHLVKFPYDPDPTSGAKDNLREAAQWARLQNNRDIQQFFMPVESIGKNGRWLVMDGPSNSSPSLTKPVLRTQYQRITRLLGRQGIDIVIDDETTVFHGGSVRLFDYAEINEGKIQ
jgi:hypothetical protein